jgi:hypothetical protein
MPYLGTLTPEEAEALGIPRSVRVISPAYGPRSKASTSSKNPPCSSGSKKLGTSQPSEASNSAPARDMNDPRVVKSIQDAVDREIASWDEPTSPAPTIPGSNGST